MSEVVRCDVCGAIVDPSRPRALCEPPWIAVEDGGPRQHVCSADCLLELAVRMGANQSTAAPTPPAHPDDATKVAGSEEA